MIEDFSEYEYDTGRFFLGEDISTGKSLGIATERHAITIAGAGSGKGVAVIIPNLLKWNANALVIDPKGEAVEATAKQREAMGQTVHVLAPFDEGKVEERFLASYNPLDFIDIDGLTARDDVELIADGIVLQNPKDPASHWDEGARALISGVIAYVLLKEENPENKNLIRVRDIIADKGLLDECMTEARTVEGLDGLAMDGASTYMAQEAGYFVSNAEKHTRWLSNKAMRRVLSSSSFSLSDLKHENTTVYLVLPARYIGRHGRFLRLFVRCSIEAMQQEKRAFRDKQCLFFLDEFFALGYIHEILVSAGLMRGYGLQLWPILQDLGQLQTLYGQEGAQSFFANSDVHQFFGNTDMQTLEYMSRVVGVVSMEEIPEPPDVPIQTAPISAPQSIGLDGKPQTSGIGELAALVGNMMASVNQQKYQTATTYYQRDVSMVGRPRIPVDEMSKLVQRKNDVVADTMLVILHGSEAGFIKPAPYFRETVSTEGENNETEQLEEGNPHNIDDGSLFYAVVVGLSPYTKFRYFWLIGSILAFLFFPLEGEEYRGKWWFTLAFTGAAFGYMLMVAYSLIVNARFPTKKEEPK